MSDKQNKVTGLVQKETRLEVSWADGHISHFPSIWLLHACACPQCGSTETAVRHVKLTDQPVRPQIIDARIEEGHVVLDWGGGHLSSFTPSWLRSHCLSQEERAQRTFQPKVWSRESLQSLPYMDYGEVAQDPAQHLAFLETLRDLGFVILRGVPAARERTEEIASLVGKLRLTNYGIFELESKPNPELVGDLAVALEPHTDEPYRIDPPGITFFHILTQAEEGGDTTLADGFHIAETLRRRNPSAFEILATTPARFHRSLREGRTFEHQASIISRDRDGTVTGMRLLDRGMAPLDAPINEVEPFYDALRLLLDIVYGGEGRITVKLKAGEMLVFNNQRLLHGRTAFAPGEARRHVRSCHVDLDEFHSKLRTAYRSIGRTEAWMRMGSGSCG